MILQKELIDGIEVLHSPKDIIVQKDNSKIVEIKNAKHIILNSEEKNKKYKEQLVHEITTFL